MENMNGCTREGGKKNPCLLNLVLLDCYELYPSTLRGQQIFVQRKMVGSRRCFRSYRILSTHTYTHTHTHTHTRPSQFQFWNDPDSSSLFLSLPFPFFFCRTHTLAFYDHQPRDSPPEFTARHPPQAGRISGASMHLSLAQ